MTNNILIQIVKHALTMHDVMGKTPTEINGFFSGAYMSASVISEDKKLIEELKFWAHTDYSDPECINDLREVLSFMELNK